MIKRILLSLLFVCCFFLASPLSVQAKDILSPGADCSGNNGTGSSAVCTDVNNAGSTPDDPVVKTLRGITTIVATIAGAGAILLILVGSIQYITSGGDSNKINNAKNTIVYALIGVLVIALAATIIEFVIGYL